MRAVVTLLCLGGCAGGGFEEHLVETEGRADQLLVTELDAPGGGLVPAVVASSATRGQLDVFVREGSGFRASGSFFAGGSPLAVRAGRVAGRVAFLVAADRRRAWLSVARADAPTELLLPVRLPPAIGPEGALAFGDLDGDGSDDAVLTESGRILVYTELERAVDADPSRAPAIPHQLLEADLHAASLTVADVDGDSALDVAALDIRSPRLRLYYGPLGEEGPSAVVDVVLPAAGSELAATSCDGAPLLVRFADGAVVAVTAARTLRTWPEAGGGDPVARLSASGHTAVLVMPSAPSPLLSERCGDGLEPLPRSGVTAAAAAVFEGTTGHHVALLDGDGRRVVILARPALAAD
jgi:hypothetical protein